MAGEDKIMENYIVRIYRFQKNNPRHLVGIVESVEGKKRGKKAFTNLDDLWEILTCSKGEQNPYKPKPSARIRRDEERR